MAFALEWLRRAVDWSSNVAEPKAAKYCLPDTAQGINLCERSRYSINADRALNDLKRLPRQSQATSIRRI